MKTSRERSALMSRVRQAGTAPEIVVRGLVNELRSSFSTNGRELPGSPDLYDSERKMAVFVHGCFWHRHPSTRCTLARLPKSRLDFWRPKLTENRDRDKKNQRRLRNLGWRYLVIWECQLSDEIKLTERVKRFLGRRDAKK